MRSLVETARQRDWHLLDFLRQGLDATTTQPGPAGSMPAVVNTPKSSGRPGRGA